MTKLEFEIYLERVLADRVSQVAIYDEAGYIIYFKSKPIQPQQ